MFVSTVDHIEKTITTTKLERIQLFHWERDNDKRKNALNTLDNPTMFVRFFTITHILFLPTINIHTLYTYIYVHTEMNTLHDRIKMQGTYLRK